MDGTAECSDRSTAAPLAGSVLVGRVVKPQGIRGELKIQVYSRNPENFRAYRKITLVDPASRAARSYEVEGARVQGRAAFLQLAGVAARNEAAALVGHELWVLKEEFPPLGPDEYYWHEMQGAFVITDDGRELGEVASLFETSAHDVLVVTGRGHEYLIPIRADFVRWQDDAKRTLIVSPPPGLLDLND